jgi:DNA adenine methylase
MFFYLYKNLEIKEMTSYHGGKQRIGEKLAKTIVDEAIEISEEYDFVIKGYCEPFCGMMGVYKHIPALFEENDEFIKYKAGDANNSVIMMWNAAKDGWVPPTKVSERSYNKLKNSKDSALKGYVGHQYAFAGQYFEGYAPKYGKTADSSKASQNVRNIGEELFDVSIKNGNYTQYSNLKNYVIYCDPPYADTKQRYIGTFESGQFWDWCRDMSEHNIIFVSSYKAPKDFQTIFSSQHKLTGNTSGKDKRRVEKLFVL